VIVCAHGYSGNARDFDFLARELSDDARVICIDVAGRGESAWLASPMGYHFGQFIADIHSLLAHLEVKEVDWVGTSMGGLLGMMLAAQASSPVKRLVMNDVGAYLPMDALQQIARNLHAPESFDSLEAVEAHLRRTRDEWGEIDQAQWREMARHHARPADGSGKAPSWRLHFDPRIAQVMRPPPFTPGLYFWDAWYRVRCPVLLLRGESSAVFPASVARTMLDIKPATRLVEIPGCGHAPALMSDEQAAIVRDYLDLDHSAMLDVSTVNPWFLGRFSALRSSSTR